MATPGRAGLLGLSALLVPVAHAAGPPPPHVSPGAARHDRRLLPAPVGTDEPLAPTPPLPPRQRGVALGLFAEDVSFDYRPLLAEIAALGASHVALVVPLYQQDGRATTLALHTRYSPSLAAVAEAVRAARREGLEVNLFPIVRLAAPGPGEWRGTLAPSSRDAWFRSYRERLVELGGIAALTGAERLTIGSELSTLDGREDLHRWREVLAVVRGVFAGTLVYSANWDHYRDALLLDSVDEEGVVAYFDLRDRSAPCNSEALLRRWQALRGELEAWQNGRRGSFVFTEVGYRSRVGATAEPWNEGDGGTPEPWEQTKGFEAFRRAWADSRRLAGFYVWNFYGYGGPDTTSYTPRGKPALESVRRLLAPPEGRR